MTDHSDVDERVHGSGISSRGASIDIRDSRFSTFLGILWTALGAIALGLLAWAASSISELNVNVAQLNVQIAGLNKRVDVKDVRDDRQDDQIIDLRRDVSVLDGRQLRGGAEVKRAR